MKETKLISEMEYLRFKESLRHVIIMIIVGAVIGFIFGMWVNDWKASLSCFSYSVLFAGMPYAWECIPVTAVGIIAIFIKIFVAVFLGWAITPIALLYNFIQMKRYEKAVGLHVAAEQKDEKSA